MSPASTAALRQQVLAKRHRRAKVTPKSSTIAIYVSIFVFIVAVVAVGYKAPQQASSSSKANTVSTTSSTSSVDEVLAANIAANAAVANDLSVKAEVLNNAVTVQLQQEYDLLNEDTTTKPQIIQATSDSRTIQTYTVKAGDSIDALASRFGISKETIKWVNNLTSNTLTAGQKLKMLPVDGIIYTVKSGDTISSIASKYKVNQSRLILFNDLDLSGLRVGSQIILPNATLPTNERPGYVAPVSYLRYTYGYYSDTVSSVDIYKYLSHGYATSAGNTNARGQCTWYAWERRKAIGRPLPSSALGNAGAWAYNLSANYNYSVNTVPSVGALIQNGGYPGHVGVVERVNADGSLLISDMNYNYRNYVVTERVIPASATGYFNYIH